YNAGNQVEKYEFNKLVKATSQHIPRGTYYITFNAKRQDAPSNSPTTTFQAHVWDMRRCILKDSPVVESSSIKI
ncbi:digestive organ expansion factor-like protein, partial [Trifolium pratense]